MSSASFFLLMHGTLLVFFCFLELINFVKSPKFQWTKLADQEKYVHILCRFLSIFKPPSLRPATATAIPAFPPLLVTREVAPRDTNASTKLFCFPSPLPFPLPKRKENYHGGQLRAS